MILVGRGGGVKIGFPISRSQVYTCISVMHLFPFVQPFMSMHFHGFMNIFYCGCTTSDDTPLFNVSEWKELYHFPRGKNQYNYVQNIIKLVYRAVKMCGEWEREYSTKKNSFHQSVQKYFDYTQQQQRKGVKGGYRAREEVFTIDLVEYSE